MRRPRIDRTHKTSVTKTAPIFNHDVPASGTATADAIEREREREHEHDEALGGMGNLARVERARCGQYCPRYPGVYAGAPKYDRLASPVSQKPRLSCLSVLGHGVDAGHRQTGVSVVLPAVHRGGCMRCAGIENENENENENEDEDEHEHEDEDEDEHEHENENENENEAE
jgi:hypothetical protein